MPLPAGTGLSRRSFLLRSAGLAVSVYGAALFGPKTFEEGIARAAADPGGPVLVSVFLEGGADSLSLLFPDGDAEYRRLRPTLALPSGGGVPFAEDDRLRWHPALEALAQLHGEGKVTTLPAVGYTHVDQSHFTSRHYWEVGATSAQLATGWLGRYLDHAGSPDNPLQGLSLDGQLQPALAAAQVPVAAVEGAASYTLQTPHVSGQVETRMLETLAEIGAPRGADPAENGSDGTDHGAAGTGFLIGSRLRGKMVGEFPGLTAGLDDQGNLQATSDFRGLYCALLEQWFGTDAAAVIPGAAGFPRPELL